MGTDSKHDNVFILRPCGDGDEAFLFALFTSVRREEFAALNWPPAQLEPLLRIQFAAQSRSYASSFPQAAHEIICLAGKPVGRIITDDTPEALLLVDIALMPECRGRGMGAALLRRLQEQCAALRKPLRLQVAATNEALRLYERLGFIVTGGTEVYRLMQWNPQA